MNELAIFLAGLVVGIVLALSLFKYGMDFATKFIYRIKEDVPVSEIGDPVDQEFTGE